MWERELDIYGRVRKEFTSDDVVNRRSGFMPFLYAGQYYDKETELAYNRFRYYDCNTGTYISQDPIGLSSGEYNFYTYVHDVNGWVDIFGLTRGKRVENLPKSLQRRPKWRKKTYEYLYKNNPRTEDGKYISVKTQKVIEPGNEVIGHQNQSWNLS